MSKRMGVCWCVYERRHLRCRCWIMMRMCVRTVMRQCTHVMPAFVCLWWRPIAFEYICACIAREMPLMIVKIWLRCWTCRLTWNMTNIWMRKFPEILFKQYFGSYSAASDYPPPSSSQALTTTRWEYGRSPRSSRSRSWKVTRAPWRQLRSTRAGSTWRQVRGEEHEQRRDMIARWTWWPSLQE